jgi:GTP cyclohydrolase IA
MATAKDNRDAIVLLVEGLLTAIGEDPLREGLIGTPKRVAEMYQEMFRGYNKSAKPALTTFPNGVDGILTDSMIVDGGYFFSLCEHHMLPFFGKYYFAYIPDERIIGLSKISRLVAFYSAKLQVQERLTTEIVSDLEEALHPLGIGLILCGRHLCKEMRGVKQVGGEMTTSEMRGVFRADAKVREEFLHLIELPH